MTVAGIAMILAAGLRRDGLALVREGKRLEGEDELAALREVASLALDAASAGEAPAMARAPTRRHPRDRARTQPVPTETIAHLVELTR